MINSEGYLATNECSDILICPICKCSAGNQILQFEEKFFRLGGKFDYLDCRECRAISIVNPPTDLSPYYPTSNYYSIRARSWLTRQLMHLRDLAYIMAYPGSALVRKYLPNSALETTLNAADNNRYCRILDVGCGEGTLLKSLAKLNFKNLTGVDPLLAHDELSEVVRLISGDLSSVNGKFDVITFHHSLEHMADARTTLFEARELLAPDGRILIRIPTRDSLAYSLYGENWFQIDAPRHMCLHSHRSIKIVAGQAGLRVLQIDCDSHPMQFWASDLYRAGLQLKDVKHRVYKTSQHSFYKKLAKFVNQNSLGDQIVVQLIAA